MVKKIAFIGSANALGMMYALELRAAGHKVTYFVTTPVHDTLSRPEFHYPQISYPYEGWVVEYFVKNPLRACLLPNLFIKKLLEELRTFDCVILSGMFLMLATHLPEVRCMFLSHGSDLDVWCDKRNIRRHLLSDGVVRPAKAVASALGIKKMRESFKSCSHLITFPVGLSPERDRVARELTQGWGGKVIYRFDVSFAPLVSQSRTLPLNEGKLVLLCAVRCSFQQREGASPSDMKGVDQILRGVEAYLLEDRMPVELHMVEKGLDVEWAKSFIASGMLKSSVVWHKEMPFTQLLRLYAKSHVCFDQVSTSWLGAIGCYALYLGRPLIANSRSEVLNDLWANCPVLDAFTAEDVKRRLIEMESPTLRADVSLRSAAFAEEFLGPSRIVRRLLEEV